MSSSTSAAERPTHAVWISTLGGANSGKTSTGALLSCQAPPSISRMPPNTTSVRNRRLVRTIQRIMSVAHFELGAVELRGTVRGNRGADAPDRW